MTVVVFVKIIEKVDNVRMCSNVVFVFVIVKRNTVLSSIKT
jgi:hypothetical protein